MQVILCVCAWDNIKPTTAFELTNLVTSGLVQGVSYSTGALLPHTRNKAITETVKERPDFTHILFVDADMVGLHLNILEAMLKADKDIIAPVSTKRIAPYSPCLRDHEMPKLFDQLKKKQKDREIIEVEGLGFGFTLVKKDVILKTVETLENGALNWFSLERKPRKEFFNEVEAVRKKILIKDWPENFEIENMLTSVFDDGVNLGLNAHIHSPPMGEDFSFCDRARKLGFKCWLDTRFYIKHIGDIAYDLNDHLDLLQAKEKVENRLEQKVSIWNVRKSG